MLASAKNAGEGPVRQRMSSEERKAAIVEAAVKLFAEKGFRGTTTRELAAAVGVTEPVLYQHFQTKRDLYTAIIDRKLQEGLEKFRSRVERYLQMEDDRNFFLQLADLIIDWYSDDPAYTRLLLFSELEGHELAELSYERLATVFLRLVAEYIERRMKAGVLRSMDPELAARAFIGMFSHYALSGVIFRCVDLQATRSTVIPALVDIYLDGIRSPQE